MCSYVVAGVHSQNLRSCLLIVRYCRGEIKFSFNRFCLCLFFLPPSLSLSPTLSLSLSNSLSPPPQSEHIGVNLYELILDEDHEDVRQRISEADDRSVKRKTKHGKYICMKEGEICEVKGRGRELKGERERER